MNIALIGFLLVLALILLVLTFSKKQILVGIFTGIIFLLIGVACIDGVQYKTGYSEYIQEPCNNNCTEVRDGTITLAEVTKINVTNVYGEFTDGFGANDNLRYDWVVGSVFVLFGLMMLLICGYQLFTGKTELNFGDSDDGHDEE